MNCIHTSVAFWFVMVLLCVFPYTTKSACEVGKFGPNCEHKCNCLNNVMCDEGKCLGLCERGFTGHPYCQEPCPFHKFGLDCHFDCHCIDDDDCDNVNGDCPTRQCAFGYDGSGCQRRLPKMLRAPSILHFSCNNVTLGWDPFYDKIDEGEGPVGKYIVKIKAANSPVWSNPINVTDLQNGRQHYLVTVTTGLVPGSYHTFRIDIQASAHGKLLAVPQSGLPSIPIFNKCSGHCKSLTFGKYCEYQCHCHEDADCDKVSGRCPNDMCDKDWDGASCQRRLPRLTMPPRLLHHTCNNFTITWKSFQQNVDIGEGPVWQYNLYYKKYEENVNPWLNAVNKNHTSQLDHVYSITTGLEKQAEYLFMVVALGIQDGRLLTRATPGPVSRYINTCEIPGCPKFKFGENCSQDCHCAGTEDCNKTTGHCSTGQCHQEWYGPTCQRRLPMIIKPPDVVKVSCMNITLSWKAFNESTDIGQGPVWGYSVMSQAAVENSSFDWVKVDTILNTNRTVYTVSVTREMLVNYEYLFRVDVIGLLNNHRIIKTTPGVSTCPVLNRCLTRPLTNEIDSVGRRFIFIVSHLNLEMAASKTVAYVYTFAPGNTEMSITTVTTAISLNIPKSKTYKLIPRKTYLFGLAQLSDYVKEMHSWSDLIFQMTGNSNFGVTLILEKSNKTLGSLTLLPVEHWSRTYVSFGVKRSQNVYILNERAGNEILIVCSHFRIGHNITIPYSGVRSQYVDVCKPAHGRRSHYIGISMIGKYPFGVITVDILDDDDGFCEDVDSFISQDMPLPMKAFGTEFVTVYSENTQIDGEVVVQALHAYTNVTVFLSNDLDATHYTIKDHLDVVTIEQRHFQVSGRGARRIKSSHPVQVIFVLRPPCPWEKNDLGDLSHTFLMPDHLFYNEYFVGNNLNLPLIVTVIMLITRPGRAQLTLNQRLLESVIKWENVIAKPGWYVGETQVREESNIFKSGFMFGAYVYGYGKHKAYLHSAGYKSCFFVTPDMNPANCETDTSRSGHQFQQVVRQEKSKSGQSTLVLDRVLWITSSIIGFSLNLHSPKE